MLALLLAAGFAAGQGNGPNPLLSGRDTLQAEERILALMESAGLAIPELARASAPLIENARQARALLLIARGQQHAGHVHRFLINARAFLQLADSVPKPYPFPDEARRQGNELREAVTRLEAHFSALLEQREAALVQPDRDNLRRYAEPNSRLGPPSPTRPRVVFFGDSITDFWRLNEYFPGQDYVNRGISGQITSEMLGRLKADVVDLKPQAVVILAGTNDIGRNVAMSTIQGNLTMMADLLTYYKIKPVFASLLPVSDYHKDTNITYEQTKRRPPEQIQSLNQWLRSFCANRGYTYLNYFEALVDPQGFLKADLADDGLHPNGSGYRVMAPLAADAIAKALVRR